MIRLAIADDHRIVVDGLVGMLHDEADIEIVATAANGGELIARLQDTPCEVVLLDIDMPKMNGIQACKYIRTHSPKTQVVALTMMTEPSIIRKMLEAGAIGYLVKNTGKEELLTCIRQVCAGASYYSEPVTQSILSGQSIKHSTGKPKSAISVFFNSNKKNNYSL